MKNGMYKVLSDFKDAPIPLTSQALDIRGHNLQVQNIQTIMHPPIICAFMPDTLTIHF